MVNEVVKESITAAAAAASGQPELLLLIPAAQQAAAIGTNTLYANDFREKQTHDQWMEALKAGAKQAAMDALKNGAKNAAKSYAGGAISRPKLIKGSAEAREFMANLRNKRRNVASNASGDLVHGRGFLASKNMSI